MFTLPQIYLKQPELNNMKIELFVLAEHLLKTMH